jgi:uncharacterized membrane protein YccC
MLRKRTFRRIVGTLLAAAGALLMWLAPESLAGLVLLAAGIGLEIIGLRLERKAGNTRKPTHAVEQ